MALDTFTAEVPKEIEEHSDYLDWMENLDGTQEIKVMAALEKIESEGLITSVKKLDEGLFEKKWNSGLRLYFSVIERADKTKTLLLLGSGKGREQNKAINRAKESLKNYKVFKDDIKKR